IIDDIQVAKLAEDHFRLIVNASNTDKIKVWLSERVERLERFNCEITDMRYLPDEDDRRIILALQGTNGAEDILQNLTDFDLAELGYFKCAYVNLAIGAKTVRRLIQRTGYTGEDGFEIYLRPDEALAFWRKVTELGAEPAGLQARDSLRLEAGLPLYGHEWLEKGGPMPFEYKYGFALNLNHEGSFKGLYIGKRRAIARSRKSRRALVGIRMLDRIGVPHNRDKVFDDKGNEIGYVTSGVFSPSLNTALGLVCIDKKKANIGRILKIQIAGHD
ncbi:unnamed protein product, partial [marine sediment metagenome]